VTSHLGMLILFAALVAPVFAALHRDDLQTARRFAARLFGALVSGALLLGWVLYLVFG